MSDKQVITSQVRGKHTPGPWKAIGDKIYSADQRPVAHVYALVHPDHLNIMQSIPNARLMAAAPELLEFVQYVAKGIPVWDDPCSLEESVDHLEERAKRLVAKIEGDE